jgi:hypothetical protein
MILRPLNVLQLNVARSNVRMHAILNTLIDFDILLLQEPWYGRIGVARSSTDAQGLDIKGTYRVITEIGFILVEKILLSAWYISWSMLLGMI